MVKLEENDQDLQVVLAFFDSKIAETLVGLTTPNATIFKPDRLRTHLSSSLAPQYSEDVPTKGSKEWKLLGWQSSFDWDYIY